jgi:hypothetical protein
MRETTKGNVRRTCCGGGPGLGSPSPPDPLPDHWVARHDNAVSAFRQGGPGAGKPWAGRPTLGRSGIATTCIRRRLHRVIGPGRAAATSRRGPAYRTQGKNASAIPVERRAAEVFSKGLRWRGIEQAARAPSPRTSPPGGMVLGLTLPGGETFRPRPSGGAATFLLPIRDVRSPSGSARLPGPGHATCGAGWPG